MAAARPALVRLAIAAMTLLYGLISPWLESGFQAFGIAASVFVALLWLRLVFLAMIHGAAMTRYRDYIAAARELGEPDPDGFATEFALSKERERAEQELAAARALKDRRARAASGRQGDAPESRADAPGSRADAPDSALDRQG